MKLKEWTDQGKGRAAALAAHLGINRAMVSYMVNDKERVPPRHYRGIRDFTAGEVTLEDLLPEPHSVN